MESDKNNLRFRTEEDKSVIYDTVSDRDICSYHDEQMRVFLLNLLNTYAKKVSFDKKGSGVSKIDPIEKYKERLKTLKENRASLVDFNTDADNDRIDGEINMVAEFIRDLSECSIV
jgi:hypothetical protein